MKTKERYDRGYERRKGKEERKIKEGRQRENWRVRDKIDANEGKDR